MEERTSADPFTTTIVKEKESGLRDTSDLGKQPSTVIPLSEMGNPDGTVHCLVADWWSCVTSEKAQSCTGNASRADSSNVICIHAHSAWKVLPPILHVGHYCLVSGFNPGPPPPGASPNLWAGGRLSPVSTLGFFLAQDSLYQSVSKEIATLIYFLMKTYGINKTGLYKKKINCLVPQHQELALTVKIKRKQYTPTTRKAQIFIKTRWISFSFLKSRPDTTQHWRKHHFTLNFFSSFLNSQS